MIRKYKKNPNRSPSLVFMLNVSHTNPYNSKTQIRNNFFHTSLMNMLTLNLINVTLITQTLSPTPIEGMT